MKKKEQNFLVLVRHGLIFKTFNKKKENYKWNERERKREMEPRRLLLDHIFFNFRNIYKIHNRMQSPRDTRSSRESDMTDIIPQDNETQDISIYPSIQWMSEWVSESVSDWVNGSRKILFIFTILFYYNLIHLMHFAHSS